MVYNYYLLYPIEKNVQKPNSWEVALPETKQTDKQVPFSLSTSASARVLEKNGFLLEETRAGAVVKGAKDVKVYGLPLRVRIVVAGMVILRVGRVIVRISKNYNGILLFFWFCPPGRRQDSGQ